MDKNKSDIGHNSNLLLEDALKETIKDAYRSSRAAARLALKLWSKFSTIVNQTEPLTDKQHVQQTRTINQRARELEFQCR